MTGLQPKIHTQKTQAVSHWSKQLIFAGIFTLNCLGVQTGCLQTSFEKSYPEPLVNQGSLPPEEADGPFQSWKDRQKYFLVFAVNETGLPNTDLPFTQADANEIATALTGFGYQPLDSDHPILTGKEATRSAIIKSVKTSEQGKSDNDIIVIFFTGHGSVGTKDLWLQTFGPLPPSVTIDINNPAELYRTQDRVVETEPFTKRVIGFLKKTETGPPQGGHGVRKLSGFPQSQRTGA